MNGGDSLESRLYPKTFIQNMRSTLHAGELFYIQFINAQAFSNTTNELSSS